MGDGDKRWKEAEESLEGTRRRRDYETIYVGSIKDPGPSARIAFPEACEMRSTTRDSIREWHDNQMECSGVLRCDDGFNGPRTGWPSVRCHRSCPRCCLPAS